MSDYSELVTKLLAEMERICDVAYTAMDSSNHQEDVDWLEEQLEEIHSIARDAIDAVWGSGR